MQVSFSFYDKSSKLRSTESIFRESPSLLDFFFLPQNMYYYIKELQDLFIRTSQIFGSKDKQDQANLDFTVRKYSFQQTENVKTKLLVQGYSLLTCLKFTNCLHVESRFSLVGKWGHHLETELEENRVLKRIKRHCVEA